MKKIALVGAGQLGSRHLQALAKIDMPVVLQVVDPSEASLNTAQERYLELPVNDNIQRIDFLTSIDSLSEMIDLCIIATNADVRFRVFQELVTKKNISNILFEKIVFQSGQQFEDAKKIILQNNISCWVNCPRRMFPIYRELKKYLGRNEVIECHVCGGDWGLACNGIHFIDLLAFLANDSSCQFDISGLDPSIKSGKRVGFIEITGNLKATFSGGGQIEMESISGSANPLVIEIKTSRIKITIDEGQGIAQIIRKEDREEVEVLDFKTPFQSQLTQLVAKEILEDGTCELTGFDESFALHKPFLEAIMRHVEKVEQRKCVCCAIT